MSIAQRRLLLAAIVSALLAFAVARSDVARFVVGIALRLLVGATSFAFGILLVATRSPYRTKFPRLPANPLTAIIAKRATSLSNASTSDPTTTGRPTIVSRALDRAIQEVLENTVRDYVMSWYKKIGEDEPGFKAVVMDEAWIAVQKATKRLKSVDMLKFLSEDLVLKLTVHFSDLEHFDDSSLLAKNEINQRGFQVHPCVDDPAKEIEFLRTVSEILVCTLLPETESHCTSMRLVLKEVLASQVLLPTIDSFCDPDYLNQTLLAHLDYREQLTQKDTANYATFDDFIKKIKLCSSIDDLNQIRYHVLAEIMQATIIQNLKQAKSIGAEDRDTLVGHIKGELLRNRDLKRYLNQCQFAKNLCEKRIHQLGGPEFTTSSQAAEMPRSIRKVSFAELMTDEQGRQQLLNYMDRKKKPASLLRFWMTIEEMKKTDDDQCRLSVRRGLYQVYLSQGAPEHVEITESAIRDIEEFMVGGKGREVLTAAQDEAYDLIEEIAYRDFLSSEYYFRYLSEQRSDKDNYDSSPSPRERSLSPTWDDPDEDDDDNDLEDEAVHVKKLESLKGRCRKKLSVLEALKSRMTASPEIAQLEEEVSLLKSEIRELEFHMERTKEYVLTLGKWQAQIQSVNVEIDHGRPNFLYTIIVHREVEDVDDDATTAPSASGWIVIRNLRDFEKLHRSLKECCPSLGKELPMPSIGFFGSRDRAYLEKSRQMLEQYVQGLLADEKVLSSEDLYQFLIPSPEYLRKGSSKSPAPKKFFLAEAIKSIPFVGDFVESIKTKLSDEMEERDEFDGRDRNDSIAEPMYGFVREVFELRGVFKWLRRQLIFFIQITFGRSINKHMRETVKWLASEEMVLYYIRNFRDSMWPNGKLAPSRPIRSEEERAATQVAAKERIMKNIPAVLQSFVGQKNSRLGVSKIFKAFQNRRANKHLVYILFELFMFTFVPEVKSDKVKDYLERAKMTKKSPQRDELK